MNIDQLISAQLNGYKAVRASLNGQVIWSQPVSDPLLAYFGAGDSGVIADPAIASLRFIAADADNLAGDGDPVGKLLSVGGVGPGLRQPVSAARPVYNASWGMLSYDGGSDFMRIGMGQSAVGKTSLFAGPGDAWCVAVPFRVTAATPTNASIISKASGTIADRTMLLYLQSDQRMRTVIRGANSGASGIYGTTSGVNIVLLNWDGTTLTLRNERGESYTPPVGTASNETIDIVVGANNAGAQFNYGGGIGVSFIIDRALSAAEQSSLINELMTRHEGAS